MFIHLGGDTVVNSKQIIAIINAENSMGANSTKEFIKIAQEKGAVKKLDHDYVSIIVTDQAVYLSPISSLTLKKRAGFIEDLESYS